jgi:hypothetical protein
MKGVPGSIRSQAITAARRELAITAEELWLAYIAVGGDSTLARLRGWLTDGTDMSDREYDFLAQALNDQYVDRGGNHPVAYSEPGDTTQ